MLGLSSAKLLLCKLCGAARVAAGPLALLLHVCEQGVCIFWPTCTSIWSSRCTRGRSNCLDATTLLALDLLLGFHVLVLLLKLGRMSARIVARTGSLLTRWKLPQLLLLLFLL